jgi:hypothetical protein
MVAIETGSLGELAAAGGMAAGLDGGSSFLRFHIRK